MGMTRETYVLKPDPTDPDYGNLPIDELIGLIRKEPKYLYPRVIRESVCRRLEAASRCPSSSDHALARRLRETKGMGWSVGELDELCQRLKALEPRHKGRKPTPVRNRQDTILASVHYWLYLPEEQEKDRKAGRKRGRRHDGPTDGPPSQRAIERTIKELKLHISARRLLNRISALQRRWVKIDSTEK